MDSWMIIYLISNHVGQSALWYSKLQNTDTLCAQKVWETAEQYDSSVQCYGLETFSSRNMTLGQPKNLSLSQLPFSEHTVLLENSQTAVYPLASSHWNTIWAVIGCSKYVITFPMHSQRALDRARWLNRWKASNLYTDKHPNSQWVC